MSQAKSRLVRIDALAEDADDQNPRSVALEEQHVAAFLDPQITGPNVIARSAKHALLSDELAATQQLVTIACGLLDAPLVDRVGENSLQVAFGAEGEAIRGHLAVSAVWWWGDPAWR